MRAPFVALDIVALGQELDFYNLPKSTIAPSHLLLPF